MMALNCRTTRLWLILMWVVVVGVMGDSKASLRLSCGWPAQHHVLSIISDKTEKDRKIYKKCENSVTSHYITVIMSLITGLHCWRRARYGETAERSVGRAVRRAPVGTKAILSLLYSNIARTLTCGGNASGIPPTTINITTTKNY